MPPWEKYSSGSSGKPWEKYGGETQSPSLAQSASQYVQKQPGNVDVIDLLNIATPSVDTSKSISGYKVPLPDPSKGFLGFAQGKFNLPIEPARQTLESAGQKVLGQAQSIVNPPIERLADKYLPSYLSKAVKFALPIAEGAAALTPSNFAMQAGMGMMFPEPVNPEETANRWANTPKAIRESRWDKGQPTVGEDVLSLSASGKAPGIAVNDKNAAANAAVFGIKKLSSDIKNKISELYVKGKESILGKATPIKSNLGVGEPIQVNNISTKEIADSIEPIIARVASNRGTSDSTVTALREFKNNWLQGKPENADFLKANMWRENLGEEVGKGFLKETSALPEITEAQIKMWQTLRNKIGQKSPELNEMLNLQHKLFDIKNSLKPEVAKGFPKTSNWQKAAHPINAFADYMSRNVGLADYLNKGYGVKAGMGLGGAISGVSSVANR